MSLILIIKTRASTGFMPYRENFSIYLSSCVYGAAWRSFETFPTSHHPWIPHLPLLGTLPWHSRGCAGPWASQTQLWAEQSNSSNRQTSLAVLRNNKKKKRSLRMKPAILEEPAGSHVSHMPSYVCSGGVLQLLLFHSSLFKGNVTRPQGLTNICWHFFWVSLRRPARI